MRKVLALVLFFGCKASVAAAVDTALADPTRPSGYSETPVAHEESSEKLSLTLVRLSAAPLAVINGKNVKPGETVGGYRLVALQPSSATLMGSGGRVVLQLTPAIRKNSLSAQTQKP